MSSTPDEDLENAKAIRDNLGMPEYTCTNDDLKRLKELSEHWKNLGSVTFMVRHEKVNALLARLEAAEKALSWSASMTTDQLEVRIDAVGKMKQFILDLEAWRRACGK